MRSANQIKKLILTVGNTDDRIRAILLNGSRANPQIEPDPFQDFDIVFIVKNLETFINDHNWTSCFGEQLISQLPDEMLIYNDEHSKEVVFRYLMLFTDGNRIDLTLFPLEKFNLDFKFDSLTLVWLDKDNLFLNTSAPTDNDYHIQKPNEKYFLDVCNEFWWLTANVAKGPLRNEILYVKEMLETFLRPMFIKVVEWYTGIQTNFSSAFGKSGKFIKQHLSSEQYDKILATYSDQHIEKNWESLFLLTDLFGEFAKIVAHTLNFDYNIDEEKSMKDYLMRMYARQK